MPTLTGPIATLTGQGYGLIEDGAVHFDSEIRWVGRRADCPFGPGTPSGGLITPGLIDAHTHLVHGGHRAAEFEMRLNGAGYEEIARAGGGILSTVRATRGASVEALVAQALPRLDALLAEGVTTVEVKSGYGLTIDSELKMLRAARALAGLRPARVVTSWLAAHAVPPEFAGRAGDYIAEVAIPGLRQAHAEGLVDAVDGFCEGIAFSVSEIAALFEEARRLGLPVKLHAEQLSNLGGSALAARFGALSVDHLEWLDAEGVAAIKASGTVATLLPGAYFTLRETKLPPIQQLRDVGVPMALATDYNPGTSPLTSLLTAMNMGCTLFRLTPQEALAGCTRVAAQALGLSDCGEFAVGKRADLCVWAVDHPAELAYRIGFNPLKSRYFAGELA